MKQLFVYNDLYRTANCRTNANRFNFDDGQRWIAEAKERPECDLYAPLKSLTLDFSIINSLTNIR